MANTSTSQSMSQMIDKSRGRIFGVTFRKKDGTVRKMGARLGVAKNLKGGTNNSDPRQYITVWDMQKCQYRLVNRETIISLKIDKQEYTL